MSRREYFIVKFLFIVKRGSKLFDSERMLEILFVCICIKKKEKMFLAKTMLYMNYHR